MSLTGPEDRTHRGTIRKALVAFWSQRRAHHGDKVKISVRAENVEDGAKIEIRILSRERNAEIDKIDNLTLPLAGLDHEYTIAWKDKLIDPADRNFVLHVLLQEDEGTIPSPHSAPLWVDLQPPPFSV